MRRDTKNVPMDREPEHNDSLVLLGRAPEFINISESSVNVQETCRTFARKLHELYGLEGKLLLSVARQLENLGWTPDSLKILARQRVLDDGSATGNMKRAVEEVSKQIGGTGQYINLDINSFSANDVQGDASRLPFVNESFDKVIANCSVPIMQATGGKIDRIPHAMREMIRVLVPGGEARIYPLGAYRREFAGNFVGPDMVATNAARLRQQQEVFDELERLYEEQPGLDAEMQIKHRDEPVGGDIETLLIIHKPKE